MSTCPNCHQSVMPADDICENCGAVLSTLVGAPAFVAAAPLPSISLPVTPPAGRPAVCANCQAALGPTDDICEQCGMVVSGAIATMTTVPTTTTAPSSTTTSSQMECPQCHKLRSGGVKFCNGCGYRFAAATASATAT